MLTKLGCAVGFIVAALLGEFSFKKAFQSNFRCYIRRFMVFSRTAALSSSLYVFSVLKHPYVVISGDPVIHWFNFLYKMVFPFNFTPSFPSLRNAG